MPLNKEKHFVITDVEFDDNSVVILCLIEAIMSKRSTPIQWQDLKNSDKWLQGWK